MNGGKRNALWKVTEPCLPVLLSYIVLAASCNAHSCNELNISPKSICFCNILLVNCMQLGQCKEIYSEDRLCISALISTLANVLPPFFKDWKTLQTGGAFYWNQMYLQGFFQAKHFEPNLAKY